MRGITRGIRINGIFPAVLLIALPFPPQRSRAYDCTRIGVAYSARNASEIQFGARDALARERSIARHLARSVLRLAASLSSA